METTEQDAQDNSQGNNYLIMILGGMIITKILLNIQRMYYYKKGGTDKDNLIYNELTLSLQINIFLTFFILFQTVMNYVQTTDYIPLILASVAAFLDQPYYFLKNVADGTWPTLISCRSLLHLIAFYFFSWLVCISFLILNGIFPFVTKWFLLVFACNNVPSICYCFIYNKKPLWLSSKILQDAISEAYVVTLYGYHLQQIQEDRDLAFLYAYTIILIFMILTTRQQSTFGGRIFRCLEPREVPEQDQAELERMVSVYYKKMELINYIPVNPAEEDEKNKRLRQIYDKLMNEKETTEDCIICLESVFTIEVIQYQDQEMIEFKSPGKQIVETQCGHIFHEDCLKQWVINKQQCPCCRQQLEAQR